MTYSVVFDDVILDQKFENLQTVKNMILSSKRIAEATIFDENLKIVFTYTRGKDIEETKIG